MVMVIMGELALDTCCMHIYGTAAALHSPKPTFGHVQRETAVRSVVQRAGCDAYVVRSGEQPAHKTRDLSSISMNVYGKQHPGSRCARR